MTRRLALSLVATVCAAAQAPAAELPPINNDMAPPSWRGAVGTTVQKWSFDATNHSAPDSFTNGFGTPSVAIAAGQYGRWVDQSSTFAANKTLQGLRNVDLAGNGGMTFTIPNNPSAPAGSYQYVVVQLTEFVSAFTTYSTTTVTNGTLVGAPQRIDTGATNLIGDHWIDSTTVWRLSGVSSSAAIGLTPGDTHGNTFDAVVVDTLIVTPSCHSNITSSSSVVAWPSLADGSVFTNETCTPPSGSTFANGATVVNCSLTDLYGQANPCQFTVTVNATVPPPQIASTDTNIVLSWPQNGVSYTPVKSGDITEPPANWFPVGIAPVPVGDQWEVRIPTPPTNTFFRLRYP